MKRILRDKMARLRLVVDVGVSVGSSGASSKCSVSSLRLVPLPVTSFVLGGVAMKCEAERGQSTV